MPGAARIRFIVMCLIVAMFFGPSSVRRRIRSSWIDAGKSLRGRVFPRRHRQNPVQAVLDARHSNVNWGADGAGKGGWVKGEGRQEVAPRSRDLAVAFDLGFDQGNGFQPAKARLAGGTTVGLEPIDRGADPMPAGPAMVAIGGRMGRAPLFGQIEEQRDLGGKAYLVGFQRRATVGPARQNALGDPGLAAPSPVRSNRWRFPARRRWYPVRRSGAGAPAAGVSHCFRATSHPSPLAREPAAGAWPRPKPYAADAPAMGAARGLAVDGNPAGLGMRNPSTQAVKAAANRSPSGAFLTSFSVSCAGNATFEREHSAQKPQIFQPPNPCLDKVLGP